MNEPLRRSLLALALALAFMASSSPASASPGDAGLFTKDSRATPRGPIDQAVFRRARRLGIPLAKPCSDHVFLRRATLDLLGTLPTAEEARYFLADASPDKRAKLIDALLEREEFADLQALRWCDLLRVKAEFPINLWPNAAKAYHRWIRSSVRSNMPYDRFARELLTASGSNFRVPQVNFYRAVQSSEPAALARAVALTFMGVRAERWSPERLKGVSAFFSWVGYKRTQEWKEEIVFFDSIKASRAAAKGGSAQALFPDGTYARLEPDRDPRKVFADWLIRPDNPWFARNLVNRVWTWVFGRGVIAPTDDVRPDNPPANPALLAALTKEFVDSGFDLQGLYRTILSSSTYQLASIPGGAAPDAKGDLSDAEAEFACYPVRRLGAEVLIDAICQVTGSTEQYSSLIPEPYTIVPVGKRSVALPDGSITSSFLELFGRPSRDTGLVSERNNRFTAAQRLHLLNSSHIRKKIEGSKTLRPLLRVARRDPERALSTLYLTILSRYPTRAELEVALDYARTAEAKGPAAFADLVWALLNSAEFLYHH